jgi:hypothetical protein
MALSVESDYQFEPTYEEQRLMVERDLYGISKDINFPYEVPTAKIEETVFNRPVIHTGRTKISTLE